MNNGINENVNSEVSNSLLKNKDMSVKEEKKKMKEEKKKLKDKIKNIDTKELKEKSLEKAFEAKDYYKKNTKKCLIWLVIIIFALAIIGKIFKSVKGAIDNVTTPKGVAVVEQEIELTDINNEIVYAAKVEAEDNVSVVLKASGEVTAVNVKLGDYVEKGTVLFTIDSSTMSLNQAAASAAYQAALASYNSTTGGSMDANLIQAKAQRDNLEAQYNAAIEMKALGAISDADFNTLESSFKAADASYKALSNNGVTASIDAAKAQLNQAQVALKQASDALDGCYVKAPISGYVGSLNVKEKGMVQAGMAPVTIVNSNKLEINLSVSESVVSLLKKGDEVKVTLNSFPGEEFKGTIDAISDAAGQTSTYPLVIKFDNDADGKIKSGMFGKVIFATNKVEKCIAIDSDALIENGDDTYVFVEENNKARKVDVKVGINNGKEVEIVSGLKVGDKLIIQGQNYLDDGDSVRVVEG